MAETITLSAGDGHSLSAYRATPDGDAKASLVVIQEIFGVNIHIREVCDGFAADGYDALAPCMFDRIEPGIELGYTPDDVGIGRGHMQKLDWANTMFDVAAAIAEQSSRPGKTGLVGYCWGGTVAWLAACRDSLDCSVGYYGGAIGNFIDENPACPTLLHFGDQDQAIPVESVEKIKAAHGDVSVHRYAGAGHGFNCDRRGSYHADSAALARQRTLAFFAEHLG